MFSNTIINLIITIIISFGIILSIQYLWNYIKDNYSTKRTKDLVNSQIEKYKKLFFQAPQPSNEILSGWLSYFESNTKPETQKKILWQLFEELNRITPRRLKNLFEKHGFKIVKEHFTYSDDEIPGGITKNKTLLKTNQVVFLISHDS